MIVVQLIGSDLVASELVLLPRFDLVHLVVQSLRHVKEGDPLGQPSLQAEVDSANLVPGLVHHTELNMVLPGPEPGDSFQRR